MRKFLLILVVLLLIPPFYFEVGSYAHTDPKTLPPLESGDLIFETTLTNQTPAIMLATGSIYTHVGIVHKQIDGSITIIHASRHVIESPLSEFLSFGWGEKVTIRRYESLSQTQRDAIVQRAEQYIGRPYNYVFYMKSDSVYCSELPYLVFNGLNIALGTPEKIGDLHVNNSAVENLFKKRWQMHPACQKPGMDEKSCWQVVMQEPIITPTNLAHDAHMTDIYSNYLF